MEGGLLAWRGEGCRLLVPGMDGSRGESGEYLRSFVGSRSWPEAELEEFVLP